MNKEIKKLFKKKGLSISRIKKAQQIKDETGFSYSRLANMFSVSNKEMKKAIEGESYRDVQEIT